LIRKILIIHTFGLGDMIMFTPTFKQLKSTFPNHKFDFLILQKISQEPVKSCENIANVYFFEKTISRNYSLIKKLRECKYDYILHTSGTSVLKLSIIMLLLNAKHKIGEFTKVKIPWYSKQIKRDDNIHRVESNVKLVNLISSLEVMLAKPFYKINDVNIDFADGFLKPYKNKKFIGIHPGCNEKFVHKRWKFEKYRDLIEKLNSKYIDVKIFIFIGPDERDVGKQFKDAFPEIVIIDNTLDNTAAMISKMDLMITNDSGLGHIASCYDVKILTIFSKNTHANPSKIYPYSDKSYTIDFKKNTTNDEVNVVINKINEILEN